MANGIASSDPRSRTLYQYAREMPWQRSIKAARKRSRFFPLAPLIIPNHFHVKTLNLRLKGFQLLIPECVMSIYAGRSKPDTHGPFGVSMILKSRTNVSIQRLVPYVMAYPHHRIWSFFFNDAYNRRITAAPPKGNKISAVKTVNLSLIEVARLAAIVKSIKIGTRNAVFLDSFLTEKRKTGPTMIGKKMVAATTGIVMIQ